MLTQAFFGLYTYFSPAQHLHTLTASTCQLHKATSDVSAPAWSLSVASSALTTLLLARASLFHLLQGIMMKFPWLSGGRY